MYGRGECKKNTNIYASALTLLYKANEVAVGVHLIFAFALKFPSRLTK
jgi:hypothetical protein